MVPRGASVYYPNVAQLHTFMLILMLVDIQKSIFLSFSFFLLFSRNSLLLSYSVEYYFSVVDVDGWMGVGY